MPEALSPHIRNQYFINYRGGYLTLLYNFITFIYYNYNEDVNKAKARFYNEQKR